MIRIYAWARYRPLALHGDVGQSCPDTRSRTLLLEKYENVYRSLV